MLIFVVLDDLDDELEGLEYDSVGGQGPTQLEMKDWDQVEGKESSKNKKTEKKQPMSSHEKSKEKMMEEIRKLEEKQLEEKPWQLKGIKYIFKSLESWSKQFLCTF